MKYEIEQSNNLCPSYLILYWSHGDYSMNILPLSVSRTGSCLHKEVNYDTNNNVAVPGADRLEEEGRELGEGEEIEREWR